MAFSQDATKLLIKEGLLLIGAYANPETIGTDGEAPENKFTGAVIGHIKQGTINIGLNRTYAEFMSSTPGIKVRKDLILKAFTMVFEAGQFDVDTVELLKGFDTQKNYPITVPSAKNINLHHIGSDEPIQATQGLLLQTTLTNGKAYNIGMYAARFLGEDISLALSGTDYAINGTTAESFVHPGFAASATTKHYGFMAEDI